jgi:putative hemolysin
MAIKVRDFSVRLAKSADERRRVRQLRYEVFCMEEGADATDEQRQLGEEWDQFDRYAEYMVVLHGDRVAGTYRIIDRESAEKMGGFYTETEFNIEKLKRIDGNIAEMSRACVDKEYRENGLVMRMLWMGLGDYVMRRRIKVLFGVASLVGKEPVDFAQCISYLYYNHLAPIRLRTTVNTAGMVENEVNPKKSRMKILPRVFVSEEAAQKQMSPLIKGYLRLGAQFGDGVYIDAPFNTCDVFVILQTKNISRAYQKRFTGSEDTFDNLEVKSEGAIKALGKLVLFPLTGLYALAKFLLTDDEADEVEVVGEE